MCDSMHSALFCLARDVYLQIGSHVSKRKRKRRTGRYTSRSSTIRISGIFRIHSVHEHRRQHSHTRAQTPNIKCGGTVLFIEMSASMHSKNRKSKRTHDTHRHISSSVCAQALSVQRKIFIAINRYARIASTYSMCDSEPLHCWWIQLNVFACCCCCCCC